MNDLVTVTISYCCMCIYVPVLASGVFYIRHREVSRYRYRLDGLKSLHFTGLPAMVYGIFQVIQGIVVIGGASRAISNSDLTIVFASFFIGWVIGRIGFISARKIQGTEAYFDSAAPESDAVVEGHLVVDVPDNDNPDSNSPGVISYIYQPPPADSDDSTN